MATFRKWGCKRSRIAEYFGLSALGEVIVIGVYWLANLILVVCGAAGSIDFMAHVRPLPFDTFCDIYCYHFECRESADISRFLFL